MAHIVVTIKLVTGEEIIGIEAKLGRPELGDTNQTYVQYPHTLLLQEPRAEGEPAKIAYIPYMLCGYNALVPINKAHIITKVEAMKEATASFMAMLQKVGKDVR